MSKECLCSNLLLLYKSMCDEIFLIHSINESKVFPLNCVIHDPIHRVAQSKRCRILNIRNGAFIFIIMAVLAGLSI